MIAAPSTSSAAVSNSRWDGHRLLQMVAYAMVLAAFIPIAVSGEVGALAPGAFAVALVVSLARDPRTSPPRPITATLWTGVVLLTFLALIAWSLQDGAWLLHALEFALLLTASRFFQRRFAKDYLQLLGLSLILLLVAAIVQPGPMFAICFLAYTIATMWGLTLLNLVREIEVQTRTGPEHLLPPSRRWLGLLPPKPAPAAVEWPDLPAQTSALEWRSRRLITPRYFAATSVLALLVLSGSALFFFLFPRLGVGFFFAQTRPGKQVIGFSTEAELGGFGALKSNAEVVMRLTFPNHPERLQQNQRLRGVTFDTFAGNGWTRPVRDASSTHPLRWNAGLLKVPRVSPPQRGRDREWRAEIYLEPLDRDHRVLFAPPQTYAIELLDTKYDFLRGRKKLVTRNADGDLSYVAPADTALHYAVQVVEPISENAEDELLRQAGREFPSDLLARYTQLPRDLDPRIAPLARKLAGPAVSDFDRAAKIEQGLREGWQYSLAGDQDAQEPLADFLFGKRRGHCEYFSTSMVLLLRSLGIPARPVHGFAGGVYNPIGGYRMIRQGDAHAWVEVFFPGYGWRTFDPTPPSGQVPEIDSGFLQSLRQVADGASLLWYQWVVEYDLERQIETLRSLGGFFKNLQAKGLMDKLTGRSTSSQEQTEEPAKERAGLPAWLVALGVAAAVIALGIGFLRYRQRERGRGFDPAVDRAADKLARTLLKHGWRRESWETWRALAQRVQGDDPPIGQALAAFAAAYDRARYGADASAELRQAAVAAGREAAVLAAAKPVAKG
jgi:transglutaminase-like putative cysteine protease